ncbi:MAG: sulfotransferase domain-containing protein [Planctomycetes bacterium]|nr:sulfotransferase domain-containing protein [Planctomycetota bacterium]
MLNRLRDDLDYREGKLVIFGLPKCGNTWLRFMISDALSVPITTPWIEGNGISILHFANSRPHVDQCTGPFVRGLLLVRDPRDMICSFFHYAKTEYYVTKVDPNCKFDGFHDFYFNYFLGRIVPDYGVHDHDTSFDNLKLPRFRYEDLLHDPKSELERLFDSWKIPRSDWQDRIDEAVRRNEFDKLKKEGKSKDLAEIPTTHFRKGKWGSFREEMPEEILNDANERFADIIERLGYNEFDE